MGTGTVNKRRPASTRKAASRPSSTIGFVSDSNSTPSCSGPLESGPLFDLANRPDVAPEDDPLNPLYSGFRAQSIAGRALDRMTAPRIEDVPLPPLQVPPPGPFSHILSAHKRRFLLAFSQTGNVSRAANSADVDGSIVWSWRIHDEDFEAAYLVAKDIAASNWEGEAARRAVEGVEDPVYQGGQLVGTVTKYSDSLLMFLLKGAFPDKYKDRGAVELTGKNGGPIRSETVDLTVLSEDELQMMRTIAIRAARQTSANQSQLGDGTQAKTLDVDADVDADTSAAEVAPSPSPA